MHILAFAKILPGEGGAVTPHFWHFWHPPLDRTLHIFAAQPLNYGHCAHSSNYRKKLCTYFFFLGGGGNHALKWGHRLLTRGHSLDPLTPIHGS